MTTPEPNRPEHPLDIINEIPLRIQKLQQQYQRQHGRPPDRVTLGDTEQRALLCWMSQFPAAWPEWPLQSHKDVAGVRVFNMVVATCANKSHLSVW